MCSPVDTSLLSFLTSVADLQSVLYSIIISTLALWLLVRKPIGIPPGPRWRTPILGNLREFTSHFGLKSSLQGLRHTYGDIYSLFLFRRLVVIVSGKKSINRLLKKDKQTLDRIDLFDDLTAFDRPTIAQTKRPSLMASALETVFDDCSNDERINQTADDIIEVITKHKGKTFDPIAMISTAASELVYRILFDKSSEEDGSTMEKLSSVNKELASLRGDEIMMKLVPSLRYFPIDRVRYKKLDKLRQKIDAIFKQTMEQGKADWEWREDVLSTYFRLKQQTESKSSKIKDPEGCDMLVSVYLSLTRSITTTLYSAVSYLIKYENIQEEIHTETLNLVGGRKRPSVEDITKFALLRSFILETKRFVRMNSLLGYSRVTLGETRLLGYDIPKNTLILADIESLMTDASVWNDPLEFRPTRFHTDEEMVSIIDKKVQYLKGDSVEWANVFTDKTVAMLISIIVQNFMVKKHEDDSEPNSSNRYNAWFTPRTFT